MNGLAGLMDGDATIRAAHETLRQIARVREALDTTPAGKGASMLCVTTSSGSYPTVAQAVYYVIPEECDADDSEGASASYVDDTDSVFPAVNIGSSIPPQGTRVVCHACGGKWCFRWDS